MQGLYRPRGTSRSAHRLESTAAAVSEMCGERRETRLTRGSAASAAWSDRQVGPAWQRVHAASGPRRGAGPRPGGVGRWRMGERGEWEGGPREGWSAQVGEKNKRFSFYKD